MRHTNLYDIKAYWKLDDQILVQNLTVLVIILIFEIRDILANEKLLSQEDNKFI